MQLFLTCLTSVPGKSWRASTVESVDKVSACSVVKTWIAPTLVYICQLIEYLITTVCHSYTTNANGHQFRAIYVFRTNILRNEPLGALKDGTDEERFQYGTLATYFEFITDK